jgi:hypothetical protein
MRRFMRNWMSFFCRFAERRVDFLDGLPAFVSRAY